MHAHALGERGWFPLSGVPSVLLLGAFKEAPDTGQPGPWSLLHTGSDFHGG